MKDNGSTILEKFCNNDLSFDDTCNELYDLLIEKINEEIYKEIINNNLEICKMNIELDIKNIEDFVLSDEFRHFLMSKTTNFGTAAFVLQTLLEKIDELKNMEEE